MKYKIAVDGEDYPIKLVLNGTVPEMQTRVKGQLVRAATWDVLGKEIRRATGAVRTPVGFWGGGFFDSSQAEKDGHGRVWLRGDDLKNLAETGYPEETAKWVLFPIDLMGKFDLMIQKSLEDYQKEQVLAAQAHIKKLREFLMENGGVPAAEFLKDV